MRNGFTFEGFEPANTTPVPDFLFDVLLAHLSEAELKVLLYIIRRTNGFKKPADAISLTQFQKGIRKRATGEILDEGCGIADRTTILKALASLEKKGCIQCEKSNDPQGDKAISVYRIKFRSDGVVGKPDHPSEEGSGQTRPPWWAEPTTGSGQTRPRVVGKPDLQETVIQDTDRQETVIQEGTYGANAPIPAHLKEIVDEKLEEVEEELERITGEHEAVQPTDTESLSHSQRTIGKVIPPVLSLPSKGVSHAQNQDTADLPGRGVRGADSGPDHRLAHRLDTSEHAPGTPALPSAVVSPGNRHGATESVQATSGPSPEPAQPPPFPAQVSGRIPRRPRGGKPAVLELSLMGMDVKRWIEEIRGVKVRMTENNVEACNALAECDGVSKEALAVYFEYADQQKWTISLLEAAGQTDNKRQQFLSFESNWPKLKKKLNGKAPCQGWSAEHPPADNDYSLTAQLWRQEHARGAK